MGRQPQCFRERRRRGCRLGKWPTWCAMWSPPPPGSGSGSGSQGSSHQVSEEGERLEAGELAPLEPRPANTDGGGPRSILVWQAERWDVQALCHCLCELASRHDCTTHSALRPGLLHLQLDHISKGTITAVWTNCR